jgi:DNA-binding MarR family transcriptional regulator
MSRAKARIRLLEELEHAIRRSSGLGAIFSQAVADHAGISSSDLECLDFIILEGRVTAGRLAEATGLTSGAITGVLDRLEKAGYARRERDDEDRRKVWVTPVPDATARLRQLYEKLRRLTLKDWESYSEGDLKLLVGFMNRGYEAMREAIQELKTKQSAGSQKRPRNPGVSQ